MGRTLHLDLGLERADLAAGPRPVSRVDAVAITLDAARSYGLSVTLGGEPQGSPPGQLDPAALDRASSALLDLAGVPALPDEAWRLAALVSLWIGAARSLIPGEAVLDAMRRLTDHVPHPGALTMPDDDDPDALYAAARALARCASRLPPAEMASRAQRFLADGHARIAAAPRPTVLRKGYHRAAAAAALVGLAASVRAGDQTGPWATAAEEHARAAGDGPLLAELWLVRGEEEGAAAHARQVGSPTTVRHVLAAQSSAGASAFVRCWAHLVLANEWALDGEAHGARIELDCAAYDADHALTSYLAASVDDLDGWVSASRGAVLRRLGRWADAEAALQRAAGRGPVRDVDLGVEWARLLLATGDVDASAAHLAAALDACHALGLAGRLPFIAGAARDLPDSAVARQLDERLRDDPDPA